jgi:hypothetical protein
MRPNILFIMADQFRADALGCVGGVARTPNLDALAARGWLFTNAYANSAECIPSRISLATGLYPHQTGIWINKSCTLDPAFPNWMQSIEAVGYATSLFGKTHLHPHSGDLRDRLELMHRYGLQTVDEIGGPRASAGLRSNMTELWEQQGVWTRYREDFKDRFATKPFVARPSPLPLDLYYDVYVGRTARDHARAAELPSMVLLGQLQRASRTVGRAGAIRQHVRCCDSVAYAAQTACCSPASGLAEQPLRIANLKPRYDICRDRRNARELRRQRDLDRR